MNHATLIHNYLKQHKQATSAQGVIMDDKTKPVNDPAGAESWLNVGLGKDLERELRAMINPLYEDVRGTESYERKRLLGEIDRLRRIAVMVHDEILKGENDGVLLEILSMAWRVPSVGLTGYALLRSPSRM